MLRGAGAFATLLIVACTRASAPPTTVPGSPPASNRNTVSAVAFAGDVVVALTEERRLRAWAGDTSAVRMLDLQPVVALAEDGSVAVTKVREGKRGDRLEVWSLPSATRLYARSFDDGVEKVLAVSPLSAVLLVNTGYRGSTDGSLMSRPPPPWYGGLWKFASNTAGEQRGFHLCETSAALSADSRRAACTGWSGSLTWIDLESGLYSFPELALDWRPPPPPPPRSLSDELAVAGPHRHSDSPPYFILSTHLSASGDDMYVAYHRVDNDTERPGPRLTGWRIDRWTRPPGEDRGSVARIAATDGNADTRILAASHDGGLLVLGSHREPLAVRRAPHFEAERLAADAPTAAAVSADGKRIASGHLDGSLRIWDGVTGRLLATAGR